LLKRREPRTVVTTSPLLALLAFAGVIALLLFLIANGVGTYSSRC
jgi:hypothetical protein